MVLCRKFQFLPVFHQIDERKHMMTLAIFGSEIVINSARLSYENIDRWSERKNRFEMIDEHMR